MWLFKNYIAEKSLTEHSFCEVHLLGAYYSRDKTWGSMNLARTKTKQKQTQISASKELIFFSLHGYFCSQGQLGQLTEVNFVPDL